MYEEQELARLESGGLGLGVLADDVLREDDVHAQELRQPLGHGGQGQALLPLALGLAQVGAGDDGGAVLKQILYSGEGSDYALIAGYLARLLVLGDVKITAQEHLLAVGVEVANSFLVVVHANSSCFILP